MTIVDDYSRRRWVFVLKTKDEVFTKFKDWLVFYENRLKRNSSIFAQTMAWSISLKDSINYVDQRGSLDT